MSSRPQFRRTATASPAARLGKLTTLMMWYNDLNGSVVLPDAGRGLRQLSQLDMSNNQLAGSLPHVAFAYMRQCLQVNVAHNRLSSSIPDALGGMPDLWRLEVEVNQLSGAIPHMLAFLRDFKILKARLNHLSGSIPEGVSTLKTWARFEAADNKLAGSLPMFPDPLVFLLVGRNLFTGCLPAFWSRKLKMLDISGRPGSTGFSGPLPLSLSRLRNLFWLLAPHQQLEGVTPPIQGTLIMLDLHNNRLKALSAFHLKNLHAVLAHNNMMSCRLPSCRFSHMHQPPEVSLVALGNHFFRPDTDQELPAWMSPLEKNSTCWASQSEGLSLLMKLVGASISLALAVWMKVGFNRVQRASANWDLGPSGHPRLASACHQLRTCIARSALLHLIWMAFLLPWHPLTCPSTLVSASACLRGSQLVHIVVLLLGSSLCFLSPQVMCLTRLGAWSRHMTGRRAGKGFGATVLRQLALANIILVMSILPVFCLASKSVPDLLDSGKSLLSIVSVCTGVIQGVLTSAVVPALVGRQAAHQKHAVMIAAHLFINCLLPAAVFMYLDGKCMGFWVVLWRPCSREHAEQFKRVDRLVTRFGFGPMTLIQPGDVCDPGLARGASSRSHCVGLTLLKLQDLWLSKLITLGLVIPVGRVAMERWYRRSGEVVERLAIFTAHAMIAAGHLPTVIPVLFFILLCETLMAAMSWEEGELRCTRELNIGQQSMVMTRLLCAGLLASSYPV